MRVRTLPPGWRLLLAWVFGASAALALPPVHILPGLLGFAGLVLLLRQARSRGAIFATAWAFGFGWFAVGLYWIAIAFFTDAERFGALAIPAVVLLAGGLALLPGLAGLAVGLVRWRSARAQALAFAVAWIVAEMVRTAPGLAFPWNPVALVWAWSGSMLQTVAWIGQWGLGLATVIAAVLPVTLLSGRGGLRWLPVTLAGLLLLGLYGAGRARLHENLPVTAMPLSVRVVQGNIEQDLKWDAARRADWFARYLQLTREPGEVPPAAVVWPETAVPYQLERDENARLAVAQVVPANGYVLAGGNRYELEAEPPVAHNSLFALDGNGEIAATYDKVDLVPFGEFLPLRNILGLIGLQKLTEGTLDFIPGPGRVVVQVPGLPLFSPLICYEAIFPRSATPEGVRPLWLLNVTNDAWFGRSSGPYQHLAMARLRAIEEGLPLVRAANTGISAIIDSRGQVVSSLPLGVEGVIDASVPPALATPPLVRGWGGWIILGLVTGTLGLAAAVESHARWRAERRRSRLAAAEAT
jgi:apolipoprotein N-acyltransferase